MNQSVARPALPTRRTSSRNAIVDAAITTLARSPDASLSVIAEAAGVSRATLHRHFPGRAPLIDAISLQAIRETDAAVSAIDYETMTSTDYLLAVFEAVIPLGDRFHFLAKVAADTASNAVNDAYARQIRGVEEMVRWMEREGALAPGVPADWAVLIIDTLVYTSWAAVREGCVAPRQAAALACRTFLSGLSGA